MNYVFLEHTADVRFRAEGSSLGEMFEAAFGALNETIFGDIKILEQKEKSFEVEGKDMEELLYNFLEEFLYLLDSEDFLVSRVKSMEFNDLSSKDDSGEPKLKCEVVGDDAENYKFTNDVKAVTYSDMKVSEVDGVWGCEVVLDV